MKVSVIVPFLNEEKFIRQCIESLLNQDFERDQYELIFVDNNSSDGSRGIVNEFADVILLGEARSGAYAARNKGALEAQGEVLAFTDADVSVEKSWLTEIEKWINELQFDYVIGNHCFAESASKSLHFYENHESVKMEYVTHNGDRQYCLGSAANMAIRKDCFHQAGLFNPEIVRGADIEFSQRYVRTMPLSKITYNKDMIVHHNEIRNLNDWFDKRKVYARSRARVRMDHSVKPLPFLHRIRIFMRWFKNDPAPTYEKLGFVFVLLIGVVSWKYIEWSEMATHRR